MGEKKGVTVEPSRQPSSAGIYYQWQLLLLVQIKDRLLLVFVHRIGRVFVGRRGIHRDVAVEEREVGERVGAVGGALAVPSAEAAQEDGGAVARIGAGGL